jgi:hypothetical protein
MFRLLYFTIIRLFYLTYQMSIHVTCFLCYIWDLSRECGMICAISRCNVLSILHVFLWLLLSTYIRIRTTLTLIVCYLFVVPSSSVLYFPLHVLYLFFCLHWFCYFFVALVDRFSCALVGWICYTDCWFLLLAAPVLHFCNPFFLAYFSTTLLRPCTLVSTLLASSLTCIAAFETK